MQEPPPPTDDAYEPAPPRPLEPGSLRQALRHPRRYLHDRSLRSWLHHAGRFDAALAEALSDLPKAQQRELAAWMAQEGSMPSDSVAVARALMGLPRPLRRGVWDLAHYDDSRGWPGQQLNAPWLVRIATLPEALLAKWVAWAPKLQSMPRDPEVRAAWVRARENAALSYHHAMTWLAQAPASQLPGLALLAICQPDTFGAVAAHMRRLSISASDEAVADALRTRLHPGPRPSAQNGPIAALLDVLLDLRDIVHPPNPLAPHWAASYLRHKHEGSLATREAIGCLARQPGAGDALLQVFEVPVGYREQVARMLVTVARQGYEATWRWLKRRRAPESVALLVANAGCARPDLADLHTTWEGRRLVGNFLPRLREEDLGAHVHVLHDAGVDIEAASRWIDATAYESDTNALALRDQIIALGRAPGWTWTDAAAALISLEPALRPVLVRRPECQPSRRGDRWLRKRLLQLNETAWAVAKGLRSGMGDARWLEALEAMPPEALLRLRENSMQLAQLDVILTLTREPVRARPPEDWNLFGPDIPFYDLPPDDGEGRPFDLMPPTNALEEALRWMTLQPTQGPLPAVTATEPWERHRQSAARAAALALRPPVDLHLPETVQAASLRGAHALAAALGAHANLPPHALGALRAQVSRQAWVDPDLSEQDAARGAAHAWGGAGPLPEGLAQRLRHLFAPLSCDTLSELFAFCDSLALPESLGTPLRVAALEALEPPGGAHLDHRAFTCAVCDAEPPAHTHLEGCVCAPALCDGCAAEAVTRVSDRLTCPTACPVPLNREYLERLGVPPAVREQRLVALHRDRLRRVPGWFLAPEGLRGHDEPPSPIGPHEIPPIRAGHDATSLRLLLSGLAAWPNCNGDGVHRECYDCARPVQKGEACLHMRCGGARPHDWDFERGPYDQQPRFATAGVAAQGYIPLGRGPLARAGFYDGLPRGVMSAETRERVEQRRQAWLAQLGGAVQPHAEHATLPGQ